MDRIIEEEERKDQFEAIIDSSRIEEVQDSQNPQEIIQDQLSEGFEEDKGQNFRLDPTRLGTD